MSGSITLQRRLANLRRERSPAAPPSLGGTEPRNRHDGLAERLAGALDGAVVRMERGSYVRLESPTRSLDVDRDRLARLPGQPPATVPLLCLDTETTGLATAAGTLAFLVGLGWWEATRFRQVQLLLPDQPDEPALLSALAAHIPGDAWLVTYNGRGFDWPLLTARYRMDRRAAPDHAGHLDLLPLVRRLFRHRLPDARLRTVETELLGLRRHGDVDGWEIPGRYLDFLRGGSPAPLADVARHNDKDVRSLAHLLAHVAIRLGDPDRWPAAPRGDLVALARAFRSERRHGDVLDCLDAAIGPGDARGAPERREGDAILAERARTLRRLGRHLDALAAWRALADGGGPFTGVALVEVAKTLEHRRGDPAGALAIVERAGALAARSRQLGRPMPLLEADLVRRLRRLEARLARSGPRPRLA
jgi:uncharacterized protein